MIRQCILNFDTCVSSFYRATCLKVVNPSCFVRIEFENISISVTRGVQAVEEKTKSTTRRHPKMWPTGIFFLGGKLHWRRFENLPQGVLFASTASACCLDLQYASCRASCILLRILRCHIASLPACAPCIILVYLCSFLYGCYATSLTR